LPRPAAVSQTRALRAFWRGVEISPGDVEMTTGDVEMTTGDVETTTGTVEMTAGSVETTTRLPTLPWDLLERRMGWASMLTR